MALLTSPQPNPKPPQFPPLRRLRSSPAALNLRRRRNAEPNTLFCMGITKNRNGTVWSFARSAMAEPEAPGQRILLSDVVVKRPRKVIFSVRKWNVKDLLTGGTVLGFHLLAPFQFSYGAFWVFVSLYVVTGLLGITLSYHRNLSHRSFKLPKFLEYLFAYCGVFALQCGGTSNAGDLEKQPFYRFIQRTYILHTIALGVLLYALGGLPFIVWGLGVRTVWVYHITWLVNSACHVWGRQAWNTGDLSRNNWWVALLAFGEGWHNNHHAFEYSARHGLEWWQLDMTWYVIRLLQALGLASDVKLPSHAQKMRMAFNNGSIAIDG